MYRAGLAVNMPITDENTYYSNFEAEFRNFWIISNYYCVFTGLDLLPDHPLPSLSFRPESVASAEHAFAAIKNEQRELVATLPTTYEYLRQLHGM
jgi:tryptophan 6-halogenase